MTLSKLTMRALIMCGCFLVLSFVIGCAKPPPVPDGSSGIKGVCLLPRIGGTPDEVGKRPIWHGLVVIASHTNITSQDSRWGLDFEQMQMIEANTSCH